MLCPTDVTDYWKILSPEDHEWQRLGTTPMMEKGLASTIVHGVLCCFLGLLRNKLCFGFGSPTKDQLPTQDKSVPREAHIDIKHLICRTDPWGLILIYEKDSRRWLSAYKLAPLVFADEEDENHDKWPS